VTTRFRPRGVQDRRNLINRLALTKERVIQADSRSALKNDFELRRHARKMHEGAATAVYSNDEGFGSNEFRAA
jgi:hypothetical protein